MSIQGSINSMISSASHAVGMVKGYQALKKREAEKAAKAAGKQSVTPQVSREQANAIMEQERQNQIGQKQDFESYIKGLDTNFGGKVGDLPEAMQKQIFEQLSKEKK